MIDDALLLLLLLLLLAVSPPCVSRFCFWCCVACMLRCVALRCVMVFAVFVSNVKLQIACTLPIL